MATVRKDILTLKAMVAAGAITMKKALDRLPGEA
jgi:hypothetical protein